MLQGWEGLTFMQTGAMGLWCVLVRFIEEPRLHKFYIREHTCTLTNTYTHAHKHARIHLHTHIHTHTDYGTLRRYLI